jgi:hypothetical protein
LKPSVSYICIRDQPGLVKLRSPYNHCRDNRGSDTAAHISREVHQAGDGVALVRSNSDVSRRRGWDKDETHRQILADA